MEKDFNAIKKLKEQGKKLLIYMPTFRDTGKNIADWLSSNRIKDFLQRNNVVLLCKLHPADKNFILAKSSDELYIIDGNTDIYPILNYTDGLISDYSSIVLDYLIVDKPIIYYPIDLEEYQKQCHEFYVPYDEFIAGDKVINEEEMVNAMQNIINGKDNYKECRKELRCKMFKYQNGKNCERFFKFLEELNKQ